MQSFLSTPLALVNPTAFLKSPPFLLFIHHLFTTSIKILPAIFSEHCKLSRDSDQYVSYQYNNITHSTQNRALLEYLSVKRRLLFFPNVFKSFTLHRSRLSRTTPLQLGTLEYSTILLNTNCKFQILLLFRNAEQWLFSQAPFPPPCFHIHSSVDGHLG